MILCRFCEKLSDVKKKKKKKKKRESLTLETKTGLHSVPVPTAVMNQIGFDIWKLLEVSGDCWLVVYIDYSINGEKEKTSAKGLKRNHLEIKRQ